MKGVNSIIFLVGLIAGVWGVTSLIVARMDDMAAHRLVVISNQTIVAEVARTPEAREKGLGGHAPLSKDEGMLFLFDHPETYGFWMKGMQFPLDMVWIAGNRIVGITENIDPQIGAADADLKLYYPPEPVDTVLELQAGRAHLLYAQPGDIVKYSSIPANK